jgi:hypothetical protein
MRKAGAVIAAENGATHDDLKAIFGWDTSKQVDLYTRMAQRNWLAGSALPLITLEQGSNKTLPLLAAVQSGGSVFGKKA